MSPDRLKHVVSRGAHTVLPESLLGKLGILVGGVVVAISILNPSNGKIPFTNISIPSFTPPGLPTQSNQENPTVPTPSNPNDTEPMIDPCAVQRYGDPPPRGITVGGVLYSNPGKCGRYKGVGFFTCPKESWGENQGNDPINGKLPNGTIVPGGVIYLPGGPLSDGSFGVVESPYSGAAVCQ